MNLRSVWDFIAGESRLTPLAVAIAIIAVLVMHKFMADAGHAVSIIFVAIIAGGLVAGVLEKI